MVDINSEHPLALICCPFGKKTGARGEARVCVRVCLARNTKAQERKSARGHSLGQLRPASLEGWKLRRLLVRLHQDLLTVGFASQLL